MKYYLDDSVMETLAYADRARRDTLFLFLEQLLREGTFSLNASILSLSRLVTKFHQDGLFSESARQTIRDLQILCQFHEFGPADFKVALGLQTEYAFKLSVAEHLALCERLNIDQLLTCAPDLYHNANAALLKIITPPL